MALTQEDLQAIGALVDEKLEKLEEKLETTLEEKLETTLEAKLETKLEAKLEEKLRPIIEQQEVHTKAIASLESNVARLSEQQDVNTRAILRLENNIMHELKLLNENLPDAVARNEQLKELESTVDNHDHRIFALEQKAVNG